LDRAKLWLAGDAITVEIAAERPLAEVGCGAEVAAVLAGCGWLTQPTIWPAREVLVIPVAGRGFVTAVGCVDVVVAEDRVSLTAMACGAADATAVVDTLVLRPIAPPLPVTDGAGFATVKAGVVTDDVGVVGVRVVGAVGVVGVVDLGEVIGDMAVVGDVGVVDCVGAVGADAAPVVMCRFL
jgi:hypothetical protein